MNKNYTWKNALIWEIPALHDENNIPIAIINRLGTTPEKWVAKLIVNKTQIDLPGKNVFDSVDLAKQALENWFTTNE